MADGTQPGDIEHKDKLYDGVCPVCGEQYDGWVSWGHIGRIGRAEDFCLKDNYAFFHSEGEKFRMGYPD